MIVAALVAGGLLLRPTLSDARNGGVSPTEAVRLMNREKATVIDVSEPGEFAAGHIVGARNIPIGRLEVAPELPKNKTLPVVPYAGTEARYPTQELVTASKYPMPRMFYAYLNRAPGKPVAPPVNEVLHYILAQEGQNEVADVGLLPGPVEFMTIALKRLNR